MTKLQILILRFRMRPGALDRAKRKADRLHKKNGWRYRVFFFGNKYRVWTRNDIRERKKSGLFKFALKAGIDFDTVSFYDTGSKYCNNEPLKGFSTPLRAKTTHYVSN